MAAFIQRLFKNRKTTPAQTSPGEKKAREASTAAQAPEANQQDELCTQQLEQLAATPSPDELENLATKGLTADIRLKAAERLSDKAQLTRVQKTAKNRDKGVYQVVRKKLQMIREQEELDQATQEAIARLIQNARDQAKSEDTKLYEARLDALLKQWKDVENVASPEQTTEFLDAVRACQQRVTDIEAQEAEMRRHEEQRRQRASTLKLLDETLEDLRNQNPDQEPSLSSLDALQKTQENRWLEATRETTVDKQEQKQYESLMLTLRAYISALRTCLQQKDMVATWQSPDAEPEPQQVQELLATINWPRGFSKPAVLQTLEKLAGRPVAKTSAETSDPREQKQLGQQLEQTLEKLEQVLESRQLKESRQLFKTAQNQLRGLDSRHGRRYQARMQLLGGQLRELNDWQGFATGPKQQALCEQMEYLADQPMEPELKAEKIKELQNEWKALGGSSDRAMWNRFKSASDKAFEPCKAYFSAKSGLKKVNLQKREAICNELTTFLEATDWSSVDWKHVELIHRVARQEWKEAWPVEFRDNRAVQKRFDALLKQIEAPLNEERERNEQAKQVIVDKARELVEHEPLQEAMESAKALQAEWKSIGITRHRQDRKLWQAFRTACDAIFERRDSQRNEQEEQARQADESAASTLEETRSVNARSDSRALQTALSDIAGLQARPLSGEMQKRVREEHRRLRTAQKQQALAEQISAWQKLVKDRLSQPLEPGNTPDNWQPLARNSEQLSARELVVRAEILAGIDSPDADQSLRMEVQVQRLASGMGGSSEDQDTSRSLEALVAGWCLALPDDELSEDKAERLNRALQQLPEMAG